MCNSEILLIEDDFILNCDTREALEEIGYCVQSVYCAEAAFEALNRHRYLGALVTDIDLGPGPDGFDVAERARVAYPHLAVVFVSGTAAGSHAARGVPRSEFLAKPFRPHQLAAALARVIRLEAA
ncbi:response regulator [Phenylobacterium sp.]|uniref:response regulator n=1 Tax=Phenylobacterium sp. TaxID=1871053 RepID=UPI003564EF0D